MSDTKTLIEQLKKPELAQPFGIYVRYFPEKAAALRKARKENCLWWFRERWDNAGETPFASDATYILQPDYHLEPEYVDLEIIRKGVWLGVSDEEHNYHFLPFVFVHLHCLDSLPGFFCFWQEENNEGYKDTEHISREVVATAIDGGNKVYARLRKEKQ